MIDPDQLEAEAEREEERAGTHDETAEMLRRQAQEQRADQEREDEAHEG